MDNSKAYLSYCPKCGEQGIFETGNEKCPFCGTKQMPTKYEWDEWLWGDSYPQNLDAIIFDEYIKDNPQFDNELYRQRKNKEKFLQQKTSDKFKQSNTPHCPTCNSTNVQKISVAKKATGFALVGIFSSNFGKTMQCKNCGYKF